MSRRLFLITVTPLVLVSVYAGIVFARAQQIREERAAYFQDDLFRTVRGIVASRYVDDLSEEESRELFYAAVRGYLRELDRYCTFYAPRDLERLQADTRGEFGGIGVYLTNTKEGLLITGVREGYPAYDGGIRPGDLITAIEGRPTVDMEQSELVGALKGPVGTFVNVTAKTKEEPGRNVRLTRAIIRMESVFGTELVDEEHKIGYVRVDSFKESTVADFKRELQRLKNDLGAKSVILDLRGNDGGVLPAAIDVADRFLASGDIVTTRGRREDSVRVYRAHEPGTVFPDEPLVVLVNGHSASASEVVAGALQDHRRAVLVGRRTYGKFLVQSIIELEDGPDRRAAVRLTTAKYLTPFGRFLQRDDDRKVRGGLLPEVVVAMSEEAQLAARARWAEAAAPGWHRLEEETDEGPPDLQLAAAIDLLRGVAVVETLVDPEKEER